MAHWDRCFMMIYLLRMMIFHFATWISPPDGKAIHGSHESLSGWWYTIPTPLKNDGVKVSWDDDIPNMMGKIIHSCSKPPSSYRFETRTRDITDITTNQLSVSAPAVGQKSPHHIRIDFGAVFTTIDTVSCLPEIVVVALWNITILNSI